MTERGERMAVSAACGLALAAALAALALAGGRGGAAGEPGPVSVCERCGRAVSGADAGEPCGEEE